VLDPPPKGACNRSFRMGARGLPSGPDFSAGLGQMNMRVDMIDPIQRDVMMLAVRRCALGELDFVWPVQVVDGPNLDAARCNDVQVLGDLAANFTCGTGEPASAIVLDLDFHMPNGIADILGTIRCRFAQRELFLHARFLTQQPLPPAPQLQ
jgi:hypothetical protein